MSGLHIIKYFSFIHRFIGSFQSVLHIKVLIVFIYIFIYYDPSCIKAIIKLCVFVPRVAAKKVPSYS
jgi:hypothetical protein